MMARLGRPQERVLELGAIERDELERLSRACRRSDPLSSPSCVPTHAEDVRSGDTSRRHKVICQGSASPMFARADRWQSSWTDLS